MTKPLVSALIDTYNHERYIEQAIVSVLEQGLSPSEMEVIVVDDGSTDNTPAIVQKFIPRVRYLRKENGGQASAFNAAIPQTSAPIVAFLDADDWWAPGKLRAVLDAFEQNPGIAAVGHGYFEVADGAPLEDYVVPEATCLVDLSTVDRAVQAFAGRFFLGTSRLAVRRSVLERIGPLPEQLVFCADTPILTLSLALGGAILLDQPLCYYRLHANNLFAFDRADIARLRKKYAIYSLLLDLFPVRLAEFGVPSDIVSAVLASDRLDLERFRLRYEKTSRWETYRSERKAFHIAYKNATPGYRVFKWFVSLVPLLIPPRRFYQLRDWYARKNLSRARRLLGDAEPVESQTFVQRRKVTPGQLATPAAENPPAAQSGCRPSGAQG
ncbi:MAG: glycosyltransferase family 2 protein [Candidatus Acidiferrales bacterium]